MWLNIDFADDREDCLVTATVHRKEGVVSAEMPGKALAKLSKEDYLTYQ